MIPLHTGKVAIAFAIACVLVKAQAAQAQSEAPTPPPPSPERGLAFAERFCQNCHIVAPDARRPADAPVPAGVPTFRQIANKPGQTGDRIVGALISPHPPMPDVNLSREEIGDLIAYLETLRTDPLIKPLSPFRNEQQPKPPSPRPS
jgi:mono/diheme cytochrome c family protein